MQEEGSGELPEFSLVARESRDRRVQQVAEEGIVEGDERDVIRNALSASADSLDRSEAERRLGGFDGRDELG